MPADLVVINDPNATPGWVSAALQEVLNLDAQQADAFASSIQATGEADLSSVSIHPVEEAIELARRGLDVRLRSVRK